ncbi:bifunctional 2',3'-cyclic-nucleotide 2'-phosphodiesterase/3'-nucleotidase [Ferrimonas balearica]|uniref:bifunctional 2',3'-cyclic-nucleotide 2'-phosphodiesterase/3'-nucleotidase n=1 Tax=Ferrimonas balearica TaxID=44012 RepID=UPI001C98E86D|nr:bifunctional 2',3'-cyclic-nucleotide 2'-phosphodiesterase/3'-nucleotidase [Ferrimonas balearica]MBY5921011.1 bifunctional 2',3'-cyclic-nucleotide 2'-phosphodiesterase/3'-nucleotidase [Ferrimonas balearica]MBY5996304.1 bifunctional 2',3'-cyclic-nucleotide 2'-phosphodiesterase/3'-nucleotidase [Ferrimonas balearica]
MMRTSLAPTAVALSLAAILAGCGSSSKSPAPAEATLELRLMQTSDIHSYVVGFDYYKNEEDTSYGLARTAMLINEARGEALNSMLFDNGDLIQGNPLADYVHKEHQENGYLGQQAHPVYKAMNHLQYDAANLGNHEFNYGLEYLADTVGTAEFPYVNANVFCPANSTEPVCQDKQPLNRDGGINWEDNFFTPYVMLERTFTDLDGEQHELTVGVLGLTPPQIMQWDKRFLEGRVEVADMVDAAEHYVPKMRAEGADVVVVIAHSGINADDRQAMMENAAYYLAGVEGVDALLLGHSHSVFPGDARFDGIDGIDNDKGLVKGTATVMPGFWGNHLGIVDLTLERRNGEWQVADNQGIVRQIDSDSPEDQEIVDLVSADHNATNEYLDETIGQLAEEVHSFFALIQDDSSIELVTEAQLWHGLKLQEDGTLEAGLPMLSVAAPFKGGRGGPNDFTYIPAGDISLRNVSDLYIFPNTLQVVELTGADVKEWLEMSAGQFNTISLTENADQALVSTTFPTYNFDVIDGVEYQIDVTQPPRYDKDGNLINPEAERIVDLRLAGEPVQDWDPNQRFLVVTNNYRASGGGNFPGICVEGQCGDAIVWEDPEETRNIISAYLAEISAEAGDGGIVPPRNDNWSLKPFAAAGDVVFTSANTEAAQSAAEASEVIEYLGDGEGGYGNYRLNFGQ